MASFGGGGGGARGATTPKYTYPDTRNVTISGIGGVLTGALPKITTVTDVATGGVGTAIKGAVTGATGGVVKPPTTPPKGGGGGETTSTPYLPPRTNAPPTFYGTPQGIPPQNVPPQVTQATPNLPRQTVQVQQQYVSSGGQMIGGSANVRKPMDESSQLRRKYGRVDYEYNRKIEEAIRSGKQVVFGKDGNVYITEVKTETSKEKIFTVPTEKIDDIPGYKVMVEDEKGNQRLATREEASALGLEDKYYTKAPQRNILNRIIWGGTEYTASPQEKFFVNYVVPTYKQNEAVVKRDITQPLFEIPPKLTGIDITSQAYQQSIYEQMGFDKRVAVRLGEISSGQVKDIQEHPIKQIALLGAGKGFAMAYKGVSMVSPIAGKAINIAGIPLTGYYGYETAKEYLLDKDLGKLGVSVKDFILLGVGFKSGMKVEPVYQTKIPERLALFKDKKTNLKVKIPGQIGEERIRSLTTKYLDRDTVIVKLNVKSRPLKATSEPKLSKEDMRVYKGVLEASKEMASPTSKKISFKTFMSRNVVYEKEVIGIDKEFYLSSRPYAKNYWLDRPLIKLPNDFFPKAKQFLLEGIKNPEVAFGKSDLKYLLERGLLIPMKPKVVPSEFLLAREPIATVRGTLGFRQNVPEGNALKDMIKLDVELRYDYTGGRAFPKLGEYGKEKISIKKILGNVRDIVGFKREAIKMYSEPSRMGIRLGRQKISLQYPKPKGLDIRKVSMKNFEDFTKKDILRPSQPRRGSGQMLLRPELKKLRMGIKQLLLRPELKNLTRRKITLSLPKTRLKEKDMFETNFDLGEYFSPTMTGGKGLVKSDYEFTSAIERLRAGLRDFNKAGVNTGGFSWEWGIEKEGQASRSAEGFEKLRLESESQFRFKDRDRVRFWFRDRDITRTKEALKEAEVFRTNNLLQFPTFFGGERTAQIERQAQREITTTELIRQLEQLRGMTRRPKLPRFEKKKKRKSLGSSFDVFIIEKRRPKTIARGLSEPVALDIGARAVTKSLRATFGIRKSDLPVQDIGSEREFSRYRNLFREPTRKSPYRKYGRVFVQKQSKTGMFGGRLAFPQELKEIQSARRNKMERYLQ